MKSKYINLLMGIFLFSSISMSCSDQFLKDKRDYNNMTTVDVFSDPVQATAVFGTIYKQILGRYNSPFCGSDPLMRQNQNTGGKQYIFTEEISDGGFRGANYNGSNNKTTKAGNHISNPPYWNDPRNSSNFNKFERYTLFPTIYVINNYIQEIDRSRALISNEEFWNNLKGQAIFARAWLYFDAVRLWGGVPYYCTEIDSPLSGDRSVRMPVTEVIDKICADFEYASTLLPSVWDAKNDGRFTSVAALAMISRVRVYAASPVFNASWEDANSKRWKNALNASLAAETAANAAGYGVSVNDIESWDKAFYAYNGVFNPEAIIKVPKSDNTLVGVFNNWESLVRPGAVSSTTNSGLVAPSDIVDIFPMSSGKRPTVENGYDDERFYRNRDPRFYKTFAFSGCEWPGTKTQLWLFAYKYSSSSGNMYRYTDGSRGDGGAQKKSRAIVWKMSNPNIPVGGESTSGTDIIEYRYAEILLNVAECYAALGDAANCLNYLKKIRQRVGVNSADNYGLGNISDRYELIEAVLYERLIELAYEGKRSWDMRRWLLYEGGAGFDPRLAGIDADNGYDPELAWGAGWKIYDGQQGRPNYSKSNNVLTKLNLSRFCGVKHTSKIWAYDFETVHNVDEFVTENNITVVNHPLKDNDLFKSVPGIKRDMNEYQRDLAFDKLEEFYDGVGMKTIDPADPTKMGYRYGMDTGDKVSDQKFLFSWRGWYYIYPIHYDMYDSAKGNDWIEQTAGWMVENRNPSGTSAAEQNGTYIYCLPE